MEDSCLLKILREICRLAPDRLTVVGVSGGADSLCLLDHMHACGYPLLVAHFDHSLRPESAQDAQEVAQIARSMGLACVIGRRDVRAWAAANGLSLEEAARKARYHFLFEQARANQAQAVAVAHTASDQVETVLMHLLRGAGLNGLKGMLARSIIPEWDPHIPLVRPLLATWREETEARCAQRGLAPLHDPSNQDTTFFRNRLRHELIPYLQSYNPNLKETLWRMTQVLAGDWEVLAEEVERAWQVCWQAEAPGWVALELEPIQTFSPGLQRAVLRRAIERLRPGLRDIDFELAERALESLDKTGGGHGVDLVAGLRLWVEAGRVYVTAGPLPQEWPQVPLEGDWILEVPGEVTLAHGWSLRAEWRAQPVLPPGQGRVLQAGGQRLEAEIDLNPDTLHLPLAVRAMRPGERLAPQGMAGRHMKLSDFYVNRKLPQRARRGWPLVVSGSEVVWVAGLRLGERFKITGSPTSVVHLKLISPSSAL